MTDRTCSTCKHWEQDGPNRGTCDAFRAMPIGSSVVLVGMAEYPLQVSLPLATRPDFGCTLHEAKGEQDG